MNKVTSLISNNKGFVLFIIFLFVFRGAIADWHPVPTGSMKPTILEGDVIWENKMAYDLQVPFTDISLMRTGEPKRGDIIVFTSEVANKRLIKRLIGLPGDTIQIHQNSLFINGTVADYIRTDQIMPSRETDQEKGIYALESFADLEPHAVHIKRRESVYPPVFNGPNCKELTTYTIPPDHYFFLGDNRDNSSDSRCIGYIPRSEIRGHATRILLSLNKNDSYKPRFERFFEKLQ